MNTPRARPLVLTVLTGGGFTYEAVCLARDLAEDVDFVYLRTEFGGRPGEGGIPAGESHLVPQFATKTKVFLGRSLYAFLVTFARTWSVIRRRRVDAVVGVGCSHVLPMLLAARLLGVRRIFIESIARADQLSVTGKLVYRLGLARPFIVQWPDLQASWPASQLGRVL